MSKLDVKALAKLEQAFKAAALAYSEAESDASKSRAKKRPGSSDSLRIAEAQERFDDLRATAIRYVGALMTGCDAKGWDRNLNASDPTEHSDDTRLQLMRSDRNGSTFAAAFELVIAKPYAAVFANAEAAAASKKKG